MRSVRATWIILAGVLALTAAACGDKAKTTAELGPRLAIASPSTGTTVKGNIVSLDMTASGISIVKADGDTSGKTGHFHVFIDREPVAAGATIPKEAGIVHSAEDPITITGLSVGQHRFVVVFGDGNHTRLGTVKAETRVTVSGPSVDASAPATVAAGQPVTVTVKVEGVTLVKADGDTSGATGHVHVFVDRDPTATGQAIPVEAGIIHSASTTIEVPGLAKGDHTLWVVLGDGNHKPFEPRVGDKLTVTVT